ncbi:unnamed protein product [Didymodactylos carnosus]|nr:unnamed protein product [Didymodactylos carnosus]CAF3802089.1 unnamed protein product [Didymodactylos carnosus]
MHDSSSASLSDYANDNDCNAYETSDYDPEKHGESTDNEAPPYIEKDDSRYIIDSHPGVSDDDPSYPITFMTPDITWIDDEWPLLRKKFKHMDEDEGETFDLRWHVTDRNSGKKNKLIGILLATYDPDDKSRNFLYIDYLFVATRYRKKGIGIRLMRRAENYAWDMNVPEVRLSAVVKHIHYYKFTCGYLKRAAPGFSAQLRVKYNPHRRPQPPKVQPMKPPVRW